eukprot:gene10720-11901_t
MDADYEDNSSSRKVVGLCQDMCPESERLKRINENDLHKLELPSNIDVKDLSKLKDTMIKKFQRSSADHELRIAESLRTPETLLRTITYMEEEIMSQATDSSSITTTTTMTTVRTPSTNKIVPGSGGGGGDDGEGKGEDSNVNKSVGNGNGGGEGALFVYLFIWDRYRMIAKDFTLQQSALPLTAIWVECHERMARWFVLMEHRMKSVEDFVAGHGQQNGEQLNNILKTLQAFYFQQVVSDDSSSSPSHGSGVGTGGSDLLQRWPHCGEFVGYFLLFQVGNQGEVAKHLARLPACVLGSSEVQFAKQVWLSIRTGNYMQFFQLLKKKANILQAALMHRYVSEMRLLGLRRMTKAMYFPSTSSSASGSWLSLSYLQEVFLFESRSEAVSFLSQCGLNVVVDNDDTGNEDEEQDGLVYFDGSDLSVDDLPSALRMVYHIDMVKGQSSADQHQWTIQDICRGSASLCNFPPLFGANSNISSSHSLGTSGTMDSVESFEDDKKAVKKRISLPKFLSAKKNPPPPTTPPPPATIAAALSSKIPPVRQVAQSLGTANASSLNPNAPVWPFAATSASTPTIPIGTTQSPPTPVVKESGIGNDSKRSNSSSLLASKQLSSGRRGNDPSDPSASVPNVNGSRGSLVPAPFFSTSADDAGSFASSSGDNLFGKPVASKAAPIPAPSAFSALSPPVPTSTALSFTSPSSFGNNASMSFAKTQSESFKTPSETIQKYQPPKVINPSTDSRDLIHPIIVSSTPASPLKLASSSPLNPSLPISTPTIPAAAEVSSPHAALSSCYPVHTAIQDGLLSALSEVVSGQHNLIKQRKIFVSWLAAHREKARLPMKRAWRAWISCFRQRSDNEKVFLAMYQKSEHENQDSRKRKVSTALIEDTNICSFTRRRQEETRMKSWIAIQQKQIPRFLYARSSSFDDSSHQGWSLGEQREFLKAWGELGALHQTITCLLPNSSARYQAMLSPLDSFYISSSIPPNNQQPPIDYQNLRRIVSPIYRDGMEKTGHQGDVVVTILLIPPVSPVASTNSRRFVYYPEDGNEVVFFRAFFASRCAFLSGRGEDSSISKDNETQIQSRFLCELGDPITQQGEVYLLGQYHEQLPALKTGNQEVGRNVHWYTFEYDHHNKLREMNDQQSSPYPLRQEDFQIVLCCISITGGGDIIDGVCIDKILHAFRNRQPLGLVFLRSSDQQEKMSGATTWFVPGDKLLWPGVTPNTNLNRRDKWVIRWLKGVDEAVKRRDIRVPNRWWERMTISAITILSPPTSPSSYADIGRATQQMLLYLTHRSVTSCPSTRQKILLGDISADDLVSQLLLSEVSENHQQQSQDLAVTRWIGERQIERNGQLNYQLYHLVISLLFQQLPDRLRIAQSVVKETMHALSNGLSLLLHLCPDQSALDRLVYDWRAYQELDKIGHITGLNSGCSSSCYSSKLASTPHSVRKDLDQVKKCIGYSITCSEDICEALASCLPLVEEDREASTSTSASSVEEWIEGLLLVARNADDRFASVNSNALVDSRLSFESLLFDSLLPAIYNYAQSNNHCVVGDKIALEIERYFLSEFLEVLNRRILSILAAKLPAIDGRPRRSVLFFYCPDSTWCRRLLAAGSSSRTLIGAAIGSNNILSIQNNNTSETALSPVVAADNNEARKRSRESTFSNHLIAETATPGEKSVDYHEREEGEDDERSARKRKSWYELAVEEREGVEQMLLRLHNEILRGCEIPVVSDNLSHVKQTSGIKKSLVTGSDDRDSSLASPSQPTSTYFNTLTYPSSRPSPVQSEEKNATGSKDSAGGRRRSLSFLLQELQEEKRRYQHLLSSP